MPSDALTRLRGGLEAEVVGQEEAKTGLILALLAREHAYLEGPPGCGKTALAEALGRSSGARVAALRFHRDMRDTDLLGDARIRREPVGLRGARLRRDIEPGPLLQAEVAVLDDLSRAPGEALGALLRILADRTALGRRLPLETAVATAPPSEAPDVYADPLEPTQLDRFAVQVRMRGILLEMESSLARTLLARESSSRIDAPPPALSSHERRALQEQAAVLPITEAARIGWLRLLDRLAAVAAGEGGALLSDRAFGAAAPRLMRAHALLRAASRVELADLRVLHFMAARRLPERVIALLDPLIAEVIAEMQSIPERVRSSEPVGGEGLEAGAEAGESGQAGDTEAAGQSERAEAAVAAAASENESVEHAEVAPLLRVLRGRLDRGRLEREEDPGGAPRHLRPLRRFDEILDADPVEVQLLVEGALHGMPRTLRREKPLRGGALVVLRDVSASMEGHFARWAGAVVAGLVRAGARRRMRVGYIEFNHQAQPLRIGAALLHRHYREILARATRARAAGRTNYEAPLRAALEALRGHRGANRHIVLLTDGVPVLGDPVVPRERESARHLGVRIHTVFLGHGDCPAVLDAISLETGGTRFAAQPDAQGRIRVAARTIRGAAA